MKIKTGLRDALRPAHAGLFIWCALAALFCAPVHAQSPQLGAGQVLGNTTAARRPAQAVGISALFDRAFCSTANSALARISGSWACLATANNSVWATNGSGVPALTQTLPSTVQDNITRLGTITSGVWNGTAVPVISGGTGATGAAGARANLGLGTISTQDASAVAITGGTITGIPNPTANSDVANKAYADAIASGISPRPSVVLATAAVLPNSPTYSNGTSGVGATLTAGSNAALVVDGATPSASARVLVKDQASALQNGVYTVTTVGSGAAAWVLTRATDFDQPSEMTAGAAFAITAGTANIGTGWTLAATVTTVGATSVSFNLYQSIAGALLVASNLSDLNNAATARTNLGLGTMATQAANNVSITGGAVAGSTLTGTIASAVQDNITRLGTVTTGINSGTGVVGNFSALLAYNAQGTANTESVSVDFGRASINPLGQVRVRNPTSGTFASGEMTFATRRSNVLTDNARFDANGNLVFLSGTTATGLPTPSNASDVANKSYVDTSLTAYVSKANQLTNVAGLVDDLVTVAASNVSITSAATALTVAGASFTSTDCLTGGGCTGTANKRIIIKGAGAAGADLFTTIVNFTSTTQVTVGNAAGTTLTAVSIPVSYGTDNTSAIQTAVNAQPISILPPTSTCLVVGGQVTMPTGAKLTGHSHHSSVQATAGDVTRVGGTCIAVMQAASSPFVYVSGNLFKGMTFFYPAQLSSQATPVTYPPTIAESNCLAGSVNNDFEDLIFVNAFHWINATCANLDFHFTKLDGAVLSKGIAVDQNGGTLEIRNINGSFYYWTNFAATIQTYMKANGELIRIGKADAFLLENIYAGSTNVGVHLYSGTGGCSYGDIKGLYADGVNYGLYAECTQAVGVTINGFQVNATQKAIENPGSSTDLVNLIITNMLSWTTTPYVIHLGSPNTTLMLSNSFLQDYTTRGILVDTNNSSIKLRVSGTTFKSGAVVPLDTSAATMPTLMLSMNDFSAAPSLAGTPATNYRACGNVNLASSC